MGRGVPKRFFALFVRKGVKCQRVAVRKFCRQIADFAVNAAAKRAAGKPRGDLHGAVVSGSAVRNFERGAVFEDYFHISYLFYI